VLYSATDIPPERIKILGLAKGKLPSNDDTALGELQFPPASLRGSPNPTTGERRVTISIIGTPIDQTFRDPGAAGIEEDTAGGLNDVDYSALEPIKDRKSLEKLRQAISRFAFTFPIMNEPREGLKGGLLVLDLDYTMADTKRLLNVHASAKEAERPGLQEVRHLSRRILFTGG
jgi:ubiquitin-like domain-containing CTD phosphatase 1